MAEKQAEGVSGQNVRWTREEEAALVRKLDWRLMPFAMGMFLIAYLDRGNIANARVAGIGTPQGFEVELGLTGNDFQFCVSIFFVTYVVFEVPSNLVMKYVTPRIWLTRIMLTWGIVSGCQAACHNMAGIIVCRLLVGLAEAGLIPGLLFWISFWYRKFEIATRSALIHCNLSIAGAFSGLLATGIAQMNGAGGLSAWRWIFIIEAIPAFVLSILSWLWLPDFPHTAQGFLNEREMEIAITRLPPTAPSHLHKHFIAEDFWRCVKDPMNLIYPVSFAIGVIPQLGLAYFLPSILNSMGYTGTMSNLMSVWPNVWGGTVEILFAIHGDRTKERPIHIIIPALVGMIGFAILPIAGKNGWPIGVRYFITFLAASGIAGAPSWYAWRQNMLSGATENAVVMAWTNTIVNISGAVAPFVFPTSSAPFYELGGTAGACCFAASIVGCLIITWYDRYRRNKGFYDQMDDIAAKDLERLNQMYAKAGSEVSTPLTTGQAV